jgi:hypothetical protein
MVHRGVELDERIHVSVSIDKPEACQRDDNETLEKLCPALIVFATDALQHGPAVLIGYGPVVVRVSAVVGE